MLSHKRIPEGILQQKDETIELIDQYMEDQLIYKADLLSSLSEGFSKGCILEIDCGLGFFVFNILKKNQDVTLVTLKSNQTVTNWALEHARRDGLNNRWKCVEGSFTQLPFEDSSIELVVSINSLHHWEEPTRVLQEIQRVLVPGGSAYINDIRRDADDYMVDYKIQEIKNWDIANAEWLVTNFIASICSAYLVEELEDILAAAGVNQYNLLDDGPMAFTVVIGK